MPNQHHTTTRAHDFGIVLDLDGPSGNAFVIVSAVCPFLRDSGQGDLVRTFQAKATTSRSYEALLIGLSFAIAIEGAPASAGALLCWN